MLSFTRAHSVAAKLASIVLGGHILQSEKTLNKLDSSQRVPN